MEKVETELDDEAEDGYEINYIQNAGKGLIRLKVAACSALVELGFSSLLASHCQVHAAQLAEKELSLTALYEYAAAQGAGFVPFVQEVQSVCLSCVTYRWSDRVRAAAVNALSEAYKCVVLAAHGGSTGVTAAHASELLSHIAKVRTLSSPFLTGIILIKSMLLLLALSHLARLSIMKRR